MESNLKLQILMKCSKERLIELISAQEQEIHQLKEQVRKLQGQVPKTSHNSHKPPSSEGYQKPSPKNQREKSDKKTGGQPGHKGVTLEMAKEVDEVEFYEVDQCEGCGVKLKNGTAEDYECRQEFELPPIKPVVIEHRAEIRECHRCGFINKGKFPSHITQSAQYGLVVKATAIYLNQYQLIPYERLQELFRDLYSLSLSEGTLFNTNKRCHEKLLDISNKIKQQVVKSRYVHFDETGLRVLGKLQWLHVASTKNLTYYEVHEKRGVEAIDKIGILTRYKGCAIHDHFNPYFKYRNCNHSLCNAHHLRELTYLEESYDQKWCVQMKKCLLAIKETVDAKKVEGFHKLEAETILLFEEAYDRILHEGFLEILTIPVEPSLKRGRPKQHPAKNLLDRLVKDKKLTLAFMYNFQVPFDNNQAERDIRMTKVKQKISGCFRSQEGSQMFCRIRGYLSTARKNSISSLEALKSIFEENPWIPINSS
jgi:transposase